MVYMRKLFVLFATVLAMAVSSCSKFDDTPIWDKINDHEQRISKLEELCQQMNSNISSLQTIVTALQNNDYVTALLKYFEALAHIGIDYLNNNELKNDFYND